MTNKNQELEPTLYLQLLQQYVETGEEPDVLLAQTDALTAYLADTMRNAELKAWVMNDEVAARIFIDTMCQFITLHQQKAAYQQSRSCFERRQLAEATEWSVIKRRDNWQVLVQQIATKYHALGFDQHFIRNSSPKVKDTPTMRCGKVCSTIGRLVSKHNLSSVNKSS